MKWITDRLRAVGRGGYRLGIGHTDSVQGILVPPRRGSHGGGIVRRVRSRPNCRHRAGHAMILKTSSEI